MSDLSATAVVLTDADPESDEWYATRRRGITATDLPRILGLSPYGNARSVWHDKRGELPPQPAGEAARWGQLLEDVVAQEWAARNGAQVHRVGILARTDQPWMLASLDRLIDGEPGALEVKTRSAFTAGRWSDDVPDDVLAQVAWQRMVSGLKFIDVACLLGGQRLVEWRYEADTQLEDYIAAAAETVWLHLLDRTPPPVDMDDVLLKLLDQLYPDRSGEREVDETTAAYLLGLHDGGLRLEKEAKRARDAARAEVLSEMADAEVLTCGGTAVFTYREQRRTGVSLKALKRVDPDLYARLDEGGHITTTTSRVLRAARRGAPDGE